LKKKKAHTHTHYYYYNNKILSYYKGVKLK